MMCTKACEPNYNADRCLLYKETSKCFSKGLMLLSCNCFWVIHSESSSVCFNFFQLWAAPPFPFFNALWDSRIHQQHTHKSNDFNMQTDFYSYWLTFPVRIPIKPHLDLVCSMEFVSSYWLTTLTWTLAQAADTELSLVKWSCGPF